jgi:hypothetical protein
VTAFFVHTNDRVREPKGFRVNESFDRVSAQKLLLNKAAQRERASRPKGERSTNRPNTRPMPVIER